MQLFCRHLILLLFDNIQAVSKDLQTQYKLGEKDNITGIKGKILIEYFLNITFMNTSVVIYLLLYVDGELVFYLPGLLR